jgi:iron(III) transport system permease protein
MKAASRSQTSDWIRRESDGFVVLLLACVSLFAALPFARLVIAAFAPAGAFDPSAFFAVATSRVALIATRNTIESGVASGIGALVLGTGFAIALAVTDIRGKRILAFLYVMSLMVAPQVTALAYKTLAGPASPLLNAIGLAPAPGTPNPLLGRFGVILILSLHHAPLAAITLATGLRTIPASLIEAAQLDGALPPTILRKIVLPLLRPHLTMAALLVFVAGVGNFGIPALLGLPANYITLPTLIYRQFASFGPSGIADAAALSMSVALIAGTGVLAVTTLGSSDADREFDVTMTPFWTLGALRSVLEIVAWSFVGLCCLVPFASLLATALVPAFGVKLTLYTMTADKFVEVLHRQSVTVRAFRNSFLFAGSAAVILSLLAIGLAYALARKVGKSRHVLEAILEIPYALPGVVLAIACVLLFLRPLPLIGVSIYATPFIIIFAYLARFLPLALKPLLAAMAVLPRDQEEASALDGAHAWQRLRHIVVPNLLAAAAAGALLVFLLAFNELTVSALLWTAGTETLGVVLFSLEDTGLGGEAAAIGVSATVVVVVVMVVLDGLRTKLPSGVLPWIVLASTEARANHAKAR